MANNLIEKDGDFSVSELFQPSNLLKLEDVEFLKEHASKFEHRFKTRSMFRSKFEMEASVLSEDTHPTTDSKYWQAIGEQNVHITELISLSFSSKKLIKDIESLEFKKRKIELDIDNIDDELIELQPLAFPGNTSDMGNKKLKDSKIKNRLYKYKEIERNDLLNDIEKINIEIDEKNFALKQQDKIAQERMREIREWERIINILHENLEFGDKDFQLHHPKRYMLRYERKVSNLPILNPNERENVISHYLSMASHPDNKEEVEKSLERVNNSSIKNEVSKRSEIYQKDTKQLSKFDEDYKNKDTAMEKDPILKNFFTRKTISILVVCPHRNNIDKIGFDIFKLQPPSTLECKLYEPRGYTVSEARNLAVEKAKAEGFDYIFQVDDDLIIPRNTLVQLYQHETDIVGGMYYRKYLPLESVGMIEKEVDGIFVPHKITDFKIGDIIHNTLVLPSGCSLIKTSVFDKLNKPWYKTITIQGISAVTEDTYICQKIRDEGFDILTDTNVQCLHVNNQTGKAYGHPDVIDNNTNEIYDLNYFCLYDFMIENALKIKNNLNK